MAEVFPSDIDLEMRLVEAGDAGLYLPFDGDANDDSDNARTPSTKSGGIIYSSRYAAFGQAIQLAEATETLVDNPSFETGTTGWQGWTGSSNTVVQSSDQSLFGDYSGKCTFQDNYLGFKFGLTLTAVAHTGGIWVWVPTSFSASNLHVLFNSFVSSTGAATGVVDLSKRDQWQFVHCHRTPDAGDLGGELLIYNPADDYSAGDYFYIDGIQVEAKAYPTPYCDGSLGTGHSWSGAAHASTSSRTVTDLRYTINLPSQFTISVNLAPLTLPSELGADGYVFDWYGDTNNSLSLIYNATSNVVSLVWIGDGSTSTITDIDLTRLQEYEYDITYDGTTLSLYRDGALVNTATPTAFTTTPSTLYMGENNSAASQFNGWLDEFFVLDYALTASEVSTMSGRQVAFDGVWTDVKADQHMADPFKAGYGIRGIGPLERLGHAGMMDFALDNSSGNSGGLQGYYSPGHTNARSGFEIGVGSRLRIDYGGSTYYKWRGRLRSVRPEMGVKGLRITHVNCQDWIAAASEIKPQLLEVQQNKTADQLITAALAAINDDPPATDLDTGISTFAYTFDEIRDGNTTVFEILRAIALSEFGYITQVGDQVQGGTLQFENRHARVKETSILVTLDDDGDDDDFASIEVEDQLGNIYNVVRAEAYPRVVDATADQVLWKLQGDPPSINPGETITIVGKYTDPDQRVSRVGGLEIRDPEGLNQLVDQGYDRGFESGVSGWTSSDATLTQSSANPKIGTYHGRMTADTGTAQPYILTPLLTGFVQNDVVYWQVYLDVQDSWPQRLSIRINVYDASDVFLEQPVNETIGTPSAGYVRYAGSFTISDADAAKIRLFIYTDASDTFAGEIVDIDEIYLIHEEDLNIASSGDESDLELIDSEMGGNSAKMVVTNLGADAITLDNLQVLGKRALIYQPALALSEDSASITSFGERPLSMSLPYQDRPLEAQDFADITKASWKDAAVRLRSVTFWANRSDTLMQAFLDGEPGKRISVSETVTGISGEYFINGVEFRVYPPTSAAKIRVTWFLATASTETYWLLGTSQLGVDTYLGF